MKLAKICINCRGTGFVTTFWIIKRKCPVCKGSGKKYSSISLRKKWN
ncbi:hypothetical protein [Peribacillus alkalitolerans]|nr:hypothetical protein [Peribacillus alkalitolerans]